KLYLELESLRFDKNFSYTIHVDKKLDIHNLEIPVLLVQPYIENAIIHGLAPKTEGEKNITISFSDANDFITCVIEDSGIGLSAARELKKKKNIYHKSKGMSITQRRIALMNNQNLKGSSKVQIEELFDSEGQPSGTKVSLRIFKPHLD
ncbi:MAG: sensor histidine kinase, partial [Bacteroidota bacterium]